MDLTALTAVFINSLFYRLFPFYSSIISYYRRQYPPASPVSLTPACFTPVVRCLFRSFFNEYLRTSPQKNSRIVTHSCDPTVSCHFNRQYEASLLQNKKKRHLESSVSCYAVQTSPGKTELLAGTDGMIFSLIADDSLAFQGKDDSISRCTVG